MDHFKLEVSPLNSSLNSSFPKTKFLFKEYKGNQPSP